MTNDIVRLRDRLVFFVAVNTGFADGGVPDERLVDFYRRRSGSGLHCAIVGNVVIPSGHGSNASTPFISRDGIWATVAASIHACGTLPGIQLSTAWHGYEGARKFRSSNGHHVILQAQHLVRSIGREEIEGVLHNFTTGAEMAVEHGFGHVQIHGAHGYLVSLLIDERINPDAARIRDRLGEIAERLRERQVETSIRISLRTGDEIFDASGAEAFLDSVATLPFDFIDLSSGFYNIDKRLIYPSRAEIVASRLEQSIAVALRHPGRRFIVSGSVGIGETRLPHNAHLGICRDLIANPRAISEPANGCRNHGHCHYYSRGADHVSCPRWIETISAFREKEND